MNLIINLVVLAAFGVLLFFLIREMLKGKPLNKILLILIWLLIIFYIRAIVFHNQILPFGDEQVFAKILNMGSERVQHPISGPGYVNLILLINKITNINFEILSVLFSVFVGIFSVFVIYYFYTKETKNKFISSVAVVMLFATSYFIYPMIEARPQQLGMILVFVGSIFFYNYLKSQSKKDLIIFSLIFLFTFYYHILSFFILSFIVLFLFLWKVIEEKNSVGKMVVPLLLFGLCSIFYFLPSSVYERNRQDIFQTSGSLFNIGAGNFFILSSAFFILFFGACFLLNYISKSRQRKNKIKYFGVVFVLAAFVLFVQFYLNKEIYLEFYRSSLVWFFFFQIPNIFFGTMYLLGAREILENSEKQNVFFKVSLLLIVLGVFVVVPSVFLDARLNNLLIRVINYWTIFAAPIAVKKLNFEKNKFWKILLLVFVIILSVVNASRNPLFFKFGGVE